MKITNSDNYIKFNGKRENNNYTKRLAQNDIPINENLKQNIISSLDNMSKDASVRNIQFLLKTAQKLNYGFKDNSEFKKMLLENSILKNKKILSEENWGNKLKTATEYALSKNQSSVKDKLLQKFKKVFVYNNKLTAKESELLNLRKQILNSKIFKTNDNSPEQQKKLNNIKKNLDYFILSSEISFQDKQNCLGQLKFFVSSKYKINPQLKDKKADVLNEILNDIIIKSPEQARLTIKEVDQQQHGMCAAIAACRKLAAYQDKPNYLRNILEELNSSKYMHIYDITQLGTGKKIAVEKTNIDFNDAIQRNYRIIDASATQWMQNSARSGDGTKTIHNYTAFSPENYEIFKDSFWNANFPKELNDIHLLLMTTIKAKDFAKNIKKQITNRTINDENYTGNHNNILYNITNAKTELVKILAKIYPYDNSKKLNRITNELLSLNKPTDNILLNQFVIKEHMPENVQKERLTRFLTKYYADKDEIEPHIDNIVKLNTEIRNLTNEFQQLDRFSSPNKQTSLNHNLFLFAAAYRQLIEIALFDKDYVAELLNSYNIPDRQTIIKKHFEYVKNEINKNQNTQLINDLANKLNCPANTDAITQKLTLLQHKFEPMLNYEYENICKLAGLNGKKGLIREILKFHTENINNTQDKSVVTDSAGQLGTKPFKIDIIKKIIKTDNILKENPNDETLNKILNLFGIKDFNGFLDEIMQQVSKIVNRPNTITENNLISSIAKNIVYNCKTQENFNILKQNLPVINEKLQQIQMCVSAIEDMINVPYPENILLKKLEQNNEILTKKELDILNKKFLEIIKSHDQEQNQPNSVLRKINLFNNEEMAIINKIKKNFSKCERFVNRTYLDLNKTYEEELDEIYRETGRYSGSFWTQEEGSSGLFASGTIKIIEQITGKPYHIEKDFAKAVAEIKKGNGGGEISTNIKDTEYSGHAQFIPAITDEKYKNPVSNEIIKKEIAWHDNSWGPVERKYARTDENNIVRTDYDNNIGGKNGFILSKTDLNGLETDYLKYGTGINNEKYLFADSRLQKLHSAIGEKYGIFNEIILPGASEISAKTAGSIIRDIFSIENDANNLNILLENIKKGILPDTEKYGEAISNQISKKQDNLFKEMDNIKSEEDFYKLDDNNELKLLLTKFAIANSKIGYANKDYLATIQNAKELDKYEHAILKKLKQHTYNVLTKNFAIAFKPNRLMQYFQNYITDFENDYHYNLKDLSVNLKKLGKEMTSSQIPAKQLQQIFSDKLNIIVDNNVKNKKYAQRLKNDFNYLIQDFIKDNYDINKILTNKDFSHIITFIDNKLNPYDDKNLKEIILKLQNKPDEEIKKLLKKVSLQDFGIEYAPPIHYLKSIQANNHSIANKFRNFSFVHYLNILMPFYQKPEITLGLKSEPAQFLTSDNPNAIYRNLYNTLSYTEIQSFIKQQKEEALREYSVRESFPNITNFDEGKMHEAINQNLKLLNTLSEQYKIITNTKALIKIIKQTNKILDKKIFKQDYEETILPVMQQVITHPAFNALEGKTINLINNLFKMQDWENKVSTLNQIKKDFIELENFYSDEKMQMTTENLLEQINCTINVFNEQFMYKTKQKNEFQHLLHEYVKSVTKNNNLKTKEINLKIHNLASKHCMVKTPTLLLNEVIKLAIEDYNNKNDNNQNLINTYKSILFPKLRAANFMDLEFNILEAVNNGRIYDFKNQLNDCYIVKNNKKIFLNSDEGIYEIFRNLYNKDDESSISTLNLLCKHTGLSERFFKVLNKNFNLYKYEKYFKAFEKRLTSILEDIKGIEDIKKETEIFDDDKYTDIMERFDVLLSKYFADNNSCKIIEVYKKVFTKNAEEYAKVIDAIKSTNPVEYQKNKKKIYNQLFTVSHKKAINAIIVSQKETIDNVNQKIEQFNEKINILNALDVNKFSDIYKEKQETMKYINSLWHYSQKMAAKSSRQLNEHIDESAENDILIRFD